MADSKKKPRRWPRRLLWVILFLGLLGTAFVTLGSLWAQVVSATWARWLLTIGTALGVPFFLAALLAGRVSEARAMAVLGWGFLGMLILAAGAPWLVAFQRTRTAVARDGLWIVESVAGPRSAEARHSWASFFGAPEAARPAEPKAGVPAATPTPVAPPTRPPRTGKAPAVKAGPADGGVAAPARAPAKPPPKIAPDGGKP